MQIAWTREFLKYFGTFYGLAAVVLTTGYEVYSLTENINILHYMFLFCWILLFHYNKWSFLFSNFPEIDQMTSGL